MRILSAVLNALKIGSVYVSAKYVKLHKQFLNFQICLMTLSITLNEL